ncbi:MAG TPA: triphosphoribosyl-dephospho-CoA synthase [Burkholderiales bacterium]|jgi:triphosphoribosyl-dephospho-CoA synthase|nr:triphosphoribosyl-dephospho-CoA synthase [Burkholderiales bacterium]
MSTMETFALDPAETAAAIRDACLTEIRAFKPGNVSLASPGHGMSARDFIASADAMNAVIAVPGASVGRRILRAIEATRAVVPFNTNLGIVLLCAPLAHAVVEASGESGLRARLQAVLAALDVKDAVLAYQAIRLAEPGGLGRAERHNVAAVPVVTLLKAMREAHERDLIARQYVTDYRDIFEIGLPAARRALAHWGGREWAAVAVYLEFLSRFPDSHVVRKHGGEVAAAVSREAGMLVQALGRASDPAQEMPALGAFDRQLKAKSINPGTSADMTAATLVAMDLEDSLDRRFHECSAEVAAGE